MVVDGISKLNSVALPIMSLPYALQFHYIIKSINPGSGNVKTHLEEYDE